jgi:hypothetical protein
MCVFMFSVCVRRKALAIVTDLHSPARSRASYFAHVGLVDCFEMRVVAPFTRLPPFSRRIQVRLRGRVRALGPYFPNKAPEPTACSVTPRAIAGKAEMKQWKEHRPAARGAPEQAVAHL